MQRTLNKQTTKLLERYNQSHEPFEKVELSEEPSRNPL